MALELDLVNVDPQSFSGTKHADLLSLKVHNSDGCAVVCLCYQTLFFWGKDYRVGPDCQFVPN